MFILFEPAGLLKFSRCLFRHGRHERLVRSEPEHKMDCQNGLTPIIGSPYFSLYSVTPTGVMRWWWWWWWWW